MTVHFGRKCRPSATALSTALIDAGYNGKPINFGIGRNPRALNSPDAIARTVNKRLMRYVFADNDVPMPKLYTSDQIDALVRGLYSWDYPMVGRPDYHRKGRGFWLCNDQDDVRRAKSGTRRKKAATHFMEYIDAEREFRVHIVNGQSIKISEKIGGDATTKNHARGAIFQYPQDFHHKVTLRRAAKKAVDALELDFGAVDILWANGMPYVTEVNTAPCLTDENSDTLERYVQAFMDNYQPPYEHDEYDDEPDDYEEDWYND